MFPTIRPLRLLTPSFALCSEFALLYAVRFDAAPRAVADESRIVAPATAAQRFVAAPTNKPTEKRVKFNRDIRQILSDNCFACHGPDAKHREAELRLDERQAAVDVGAIVPGKPTESQMIRRILSNDPEERMPPPDSHKVLTKEQKKLFQDWIAQGAEYEPHWSLTPLVRPELPKGPAVDAYKSPIDRFIAAELAEDELKLSPRAEKRTELRRLSLDLIGLPPTPAETAAYMADESSQAFAKQVDRLLASPRFGERWASWWFDVARFTDTVGFHGDQNMRIFPYRDYVIDAFNANKPFDVFTTEQLAGDLLPNPTPEQLTATGFNRLNMMTREGGAQPKEYLAKYQADRVRTVGGAWLGMTLGCCECHDHKYDPLPQKDFYAMSAFFADVRQWGVYSDYGYSPNPDLKGYNNDYPFPPEQQVESPALRRREALLTRRLAEMPAEGDDDPASAVAVRKAFARWLETAAAFVEKNDGGWEVLRPEPPQGESVVPLEKEATQAGDGFLTPKFVKNEAAKPDAKNKKAPTDAAQTELEFTPTTETIAAVRLELGAEAKPVRESVKLTLAVRDAKGKTRPIAVRFADGEYAKPRYASGQDQLGVQGGWTLQDAPADRAIRSVWVPTTPFKLAAGERLIVTLAGRVSPVRLAVTPFGSCKPLTTADDECVAALRRIAALKSPDKVGDWSSPDAQRVGLMWWLGRTDLNADQRRKIHELQDQIAECRDGKAWTLIVKSQKPFPTRLLPRGNWQDESQPELMPATLHAVPSLPNPEGRRLTRLDLAKWICSDENPLTGRVVMNRLWKEFFGRGLSYQLDDLGAQGETPSHPELLDWLAIEFRESGWNLKKMMRAIALSETYRQAAKTRPELRNDDPNNRRLAFQNPRRLDAEFVRDNALSIAGLLNVEMGGPSVKPYQPEGYYEPIQFPNRVYKADLDERQYRRGVYMHWQRTFLHPMLANFDAPAREECTAIRVSSNTPQQALTLLNDPTFVEASRAFAERLLAPADAEGWSLDKTADQDTARIARAYELALARAPTALEKKSLSEFLAKQRSAFASGESGPAKYLKIGLRPANPQLDPSELAAWTAVCRVILNLHETITRY